MTRPDPWPWPADTPRDRDRRIARAYRGALHELHPAVVAHLDQTFRDLGQAWISEEPVAYDLEDLLTPEQVADFAQVARRTVDTWRLERTPPLPTVRTPDGIRIRFGDLIEWQADRRRRRATIGPAPRT
ncbi:helix-turn-helix domain-containing protein [Pseudonocardia sp. RS010]|uniref:helix-turn-helix domain-containing protein n=1 Tax=Pseudonocardia sp. RS010 TaxID=3385979 RepID=UPI0039A1843A